MPARKKLLVIATVFLEKKSSGTSPISMVSKSDTSLIASPLSDDSLAMSSPGNTLQTSRQSRKTSRQQSRKTSPLIKAEPSLTNENLMSAASPFPRCQKVTLMAFLIRSKLIRITNIPSATVLNNNNR